MVVESRSRFSISGYKALAVGSNLEVASCVEQGELWVFRTQGQLREAYGTAYGCMYSGSDCHEEILAIHAAIILLKT